MVGWMVGWMVGNEGQEERRGLNNCRGGRQDFRKLLQDFRVPFLFIPSFLVIHLHRFPTQPTATIHLRRRCSLRLSCYEYQEPVRAAAPRTEAQGLEGVDWKGHAIRSRELDTLSGSVDSSSGSNQGCT
jgi:hypothetical protein